jgi:mono/diheme cytochrome c family protein
MTHPFPTGHKAAIAVSLALAGLALSGAATSTLAAENGAAAKLYESKCAGCHSERRVVRKVKAMPAAERESRLRKFMANHHVPAEAERDLLIRFLLSRAAS